MRAFHGVPPSFSAGWALDTASASAVKHGRALTCMVYGAAPLPPDRAEHLVFPDGEIRTAYWLEPADAVRQLPPFLARRVEAALRALAEGTVVHLETVAPPGPAPAAGPR